MTKSGYSSPSIQDNLKLRQLVNYKKQGYTDIKVNHQNYTHGQPDPVGGYIPDLSAVLKNKTVICGIETNESFLDAETIKRWKTFGSSVYEFHLIVAKNAFSAIKDIVKSNGIKVNKYWYSEN